MCEFKRARKEEKIRKKREGKGDGGRKGIGRVRNEGEEKKGVGLEARRRRCQEGMKLRKWGWGVDRRRVRNLVFTDKHVSKLSWLSDQRVGITTELTLLGIVCPVGPQGLAISDKGQAKLTQWKEVKCNTEFILALGDPQNTGRWFKS